MNEVSTSFPMWPLLEAYSELKQGYRQAGGTHQLPKVGSNAGGQPVDVMLGIRYNKLFPSPVFFLPSGLGIYKSVIKGKDGCDGVIGGPHKSWLAAMKASHVMGPAAYFSCEMQAFRFQSSSLYMNLGPMAEPQEYMMEKSHASVEDHLEEEVTCMLASTSAPGQLKEFLKLEAIGADVEYRCEKCRNCTQCKNADALEQVSLVEEREQHKIEQCLEYDVEEKQVTASLPFMLDPEVHLSDNYFTAKKVLETQLKIANKTPDVIPQIVASHNKLRDKGYVVPLDMLPEKMKSHASQQGYYLPWRPVHSGSLSTPCRMVFDASARCATGFSLNCTLAKGKKYAGNTLPPFAAV